MPEPGSDLYRLEAIQHAGERTLGRTMIKQPLSTRSLTLFLMVITGISLTFLSHGEYARKETVAGYLMPDAGISRVYPSAKGIAEVLLIKEGDVVRKGEPLVEVRVPYSLADGEEANEEILSELLQQKEQLQQRHVREVSKSGLEEGWLQSKIGSLQDESSQLNRVRTLQVSRAEVTSQQLLAFRDLRIKGFLSDTQWLSARAANLAEHKELVQVEQRLTQVRFETKSTRHQLDLLPVVLLDTLETLDRKISDINQRITEIRGRANYLITAPVPGRVTALNLSVGDSLSSSRPILSILPEKSRLYAWLLIPSRAAGLTEDGQRVRLMYDSFPYQQFGTHKGTIISISDTVVSPGDIAGPVRVNEPVFMAKVKLEKETITAYGKERALQVDMLLTADIIQAKRSILEWMLNPLFALRGRT